MTLYKKMRRGPRQKIGTPAKVAGWATIQTREVINKNLYPGGRHLCVYFGDDHQFTIEISTAEAAALIERLNEFLKPEGEQ